MFADPGHAGTAATRLSVLIVHGVLTTTIVMHLVARATLNAESLLLKVLIELSLTLVTWKVSGPSRLRRASAWILATSWVLIGVLAGFTPAMVYQECLTRLENAPLGASQGAVDASINWLGDAECKVEPMTGKSGSLAFPATEAIRLRNISWPA